MNITEYLKQEREVSPPIWIMRQAGRYLPEYRKLRMNAKNFLEFCYNTDLATEATLQPIKRFNLNAAIIFSDILVIPDSLGIKVSFIENEGPVIETVRTTKEFDKVINCNNNKLIPIYKAIEKVKKSLSKETSLIGFSGGVWTLFSYIVEGKGSKDISIARSIFYKDKVFFKNLTDILIQKTSEHLINQIKAGVDIIQIFDSYAGFVCSEEYEEIIIKPTNKVINLVKKSFPNIPIICFPRGSGLNYKIFCEKVACDIISVDQFIDLKWIKDNSCNKVIQGNLDPAVLLVDSQDLIKEKVDHIFKIMKNEKFIFNLGHGILPSTPIKNVEYLINYVRGRN